MDVIPPGKRSEVMRSIRAKDTKPELIVRRLLFGLGFRYRIHVRDLPGCPDIVFRSRQKAIYVNGCFWHWHRICKTAHFPQSRLEYWIPKLTKNKQRDRRNLARMRRLGWSVLVLWECELRDITAVESKLKAFLE